MSSSALIQLVYVSNSSQFDNEADLLQLLKVSRKNNSQRGLTGMLLFHEGIFMQILEGPEPEVKAVYEKIRQDPRHRACRVLATIPVQSREFGQWTMAYQKPEGSLAAGFSRFMNDYLDYAPKQQQSEAYKLMLMFRERALLAAT